jgi:hypothetical protein
MRKMILPVMLVLGLPLVSTAQLAPKFALFGGYTLVHAHFNPAAGSSSFNLGGWEASAEDKVAPWLGIVADLSQQYGTRSGINEQQTLALFGPQVCFPINPRVIPFAHALFGGVYGTVFEFSDIGTFHDHGLALATALGGGMDIKIFGPLWFRPIQADYLRSRLDDDHRTDFRISAGFVLRLK